MKPISVGFNNTCLKLEFILGGEKRIIILVKKASFEKNKRKI